MLRHSITETWHSAISGLLSDFPRGLPGYEGLKIVVSWECYAVILLLYIPTDPNIQPPTIEVIGDLVHVHPLPFKLAIDTRGDELAIITDAIMDNTAVGSRNYAGMYRLSIFNYHEKAYRFSYQVARLKCNAFHRSLQMRLFLGSPDNYSTSETKNNNVVVVFNRGKVVVQRYKHHCWKLH